MTPSRDPARLRQGLNPLTTTSLGSFNAAPLNTPMSAMSVASPHLHSAPTLGSAIQPYNPQQWVASPTAAPERMSLHLSDAHGKAQLPSHLTPLRLTTRLTIAVASALPPPPPPYSPPRSQQTRPVSGVFEQSPASASTASPGPRALPPNVLRPSPDQPANPSFPPPPGASGRGPSRERRFGLPSLSRRREPEQTPVSPSPHHSSPLSRHETVAGPSRYQDADRSPFTPVNAPQFGPPAARRAASTGAISTPTSARSRSTSQSRWEPGMPLPPPPPGPPPSSSRSQSVQGISRESAPIASPPTRRPPPSGVSSLGPVPPTPANWVDSDSQPEQVTRGRSPGLTIDTSSIDSSQAADSQTASSSAGGLNRARAVRHDKTILQRRTESRHGSIDERTNPNAMSNIVVPSSSESLSRRLAHSKSTPGSGSWAQPESSRGGESSTYQDSRNSTPRGPASGKLPQLDTGTPPFSPFATKSVQQAGTPQPLVPKALPTPPPQTRSASGSRPRDSSRVRDSSRPPPSATNVPVSKHLMVTQSADQFAAGTIERFQAFASKESVAATDADRVRLFADFIVSESRIRRERYSAAIGAMGSEIFDLSRDLFRPMVARRGSGASQAEWTPALPDADSPQVASVGNSQQDEGLSNSAPPSAKVPVSPSGSTSNNANWNSNYMPSLSPILSMSVSENHDNDSRGRPSSRWWEADSQGEAGRGFERSKRESKYMGVPKDQWAEAEQLSTAQGTTSDYSNSSNYPPEKVGWHEDQESTRTPQPLRFSNVPIQTTPSPGRNSLEFLDVSRLVTMPPPYPRHHPAVNNNHPELTSIRTSVRVLSDLSEVESVKQIFAAASSKRLETFTKEATSHKQALMVNLQKEITSGNLGYADAAAIEAHAKQEERDKTKELGKAEFEKFQNEVIVPLNDLLTERISRSTELLDNLARHLFDNEENDADMPQEEGDDKPELLEKLTLLKWIFEARESLHRAIYDILSDRNSRYCEVVLTPYRLSGNTEKLKSAEAFFAEDASRREYAYANEVLDRTRTFRNVVDEAVERGVALQLSAFWDIAPPLTRVLDSIPLDLNGFNIQIPSAEFDENPSYHQHPLQYLYSLLLHAEKSTYQFIEAHTNLLCLLHEVKEAVVVAKGRVLATQIEEADGTPIRTEDREIRAREMRQLEERRLTEDLKEKVREVQDQWHSSLGEGFKNVKERTGEWLLETGGWDETLEDGGVGGV
ncbi:hypothetical protein HJFPF1_09006 [Paramyrothecium foliicola]|nr:hypothetical protein HJFPF1_09006 [Paramyrothecium foliicola]